MNISISRIRLFKSCRRAYELRYMEGVVPVNVSDALETGKSYHEKLEELYTTGEFDDSDMSKASAMAKAYEKYIYPQVAIKAVEQWFNCKLTQKHTIIGRVDGIADGALIEHKTTSADLDAFEYDLEWDEQIPCYMLAYRTRNVICTVVKKPTIRQKKDETDEQFYQRMVAWYDEDTYSKIRYIIVSRTKDYLMQFRKELIQMCNEIERAEIKKCFYKNPAYCHRWNTLCEYAQICNDYDPDETYVNFERSKMNGNHKAESEKQW